MKKTQQKPNPRNAEHIYDSECPCVDCEKEYDKRCSTGVPNVGAQLARLRWDKASTEEKKRVNEMLLKARAKKRGEKK